MATILVVDDDDAIRSTLYDLFSDEHVCHAAETAEQALTYLTVESYDVVLTDFLMPGLSGLELMGHLRQRQPETPVILISGVSNQERAKDLIEMGAFDYLVKPFRLEAVEESVRRAVEHHQKITAERQES